MPKKILTNLQARVIVRSIRDLNNIGAKFDSLELNDKITFYVYRDDAGYSVGKNGRTVEYYDTLGDFAAAYCIAKL